MLNLNNQYVVINGRDSRDFGIYVIDGNIFDFAIRDFETYQIPGRTGDLTFDHGRWKNITLTLKCAALDNGREKLDAWRAFLLSGMGMTREIEHSSVDYGNIIAGYNGSYKIETSIEPDIYRIGMIKAVSSPQISLANGGGYVEVSFDCSPKKYLKSGIEKMAITSNINDLNNPTYYDAKPVIKVKASQINGYIQFRNYAYDEYVPFGTYLVSSSKITFKSTDEFYIDCETKDASIEGINHNSDIELIGDDFPYIIGKMVIPHVTSRTSITISNMETVEMYPKWWTL